MKKLLVLLFIAAITSYGPTALAVPQQINYQGYLTRADGTPLDTTVAIMFKLYADSSGTLMWMENHSAVPVVNGLFNARIGELVSLPDAMLNQPQVWLGVTIGNDAEMTPRTRIVSSAYAYRVGTVDGASGGTVSGKINVGSANANAGNFANVLGENNTASGDHAIVSGGSTNTASGSFSSVAGGQNNLVQGSYSVIAGGGGIDWLEGNAVYGDHSVIGGGYNNRAWGDQTVVGGGMANWDNSGAHYGVIGGGYNNFLWTNCTYGTVGGGMMNSVLSNYATIGGGSYNSTRGVGSTISGGSYNQAGGTYSTVCGGGGATSADSNSAFGDYSTVSGGQSNRASDQHAVVAGGHNNAILTGGWGSTIGGGNANRVLASYSTISGGTNNRVEASFATAGGGEYNTVSGGFGTVAGGANNRARGMYSTVGGGGGDNSADSNSVIGDYSTVGGGHGNYASGGSATIAGGAYNQATGNASVVGGGYDVKTPGVAATAAGGSHVFARGDFSVIGGGGGWNLADSNSATGAYSVVPGGQGNRAHGDYSFAAGKGAGTLQPGTFMWADAAGSSVLNNTANSFGARATGGVWFFTNTALSAGVTVPAGGSAWNAVSDSTRKHNARLVDTKDVLSKVTAIPIKQWSYKSQDPSIEHIGPMAQDFWKQFHVGDDSLSISTIDPSGIALAAIQELAKRCDQLEQQNTVLQQQIQALLAKDGQTHLNNGK